MVDTWYCVVTGGSRPQEWQMGQYFQTSGRSILFVQNSWNAWCNVFFSAGSTHSYGYLTYMPNGSPVNTTMVYQVDPATDRKTLVATSTLGLTGTTSMIGLPTFNAPMVLLRASATVNRSVGRLYLPPLSVAALGSAMITSAAAGEFRDFLHDAYETADPLAMTPVIRHRGTHTSTPVSTFVVSRQWAIVHSRKSSAIPTYVAGTL